MWTAHVSFKHIDTGEYALPREVYTADSRIAVENMFMGRVTELYKDRIYLTCWLESPIGNFFLDPTCWGLINSAELKGVKLKQDLTKD